MKQEIQDLVHNRHIRTLPTHVNNLTNYRLNHNFKLRILSGREVYYRIANIEPVVITLFVSVKMLLKMSGSISYRSIPFLLKSTHFPLLDQIHNFCQKSHNESGIGMPQHKSNPSTRTIQSP